ncbi:MAG: hypothetical protein D6681_10630 [Calditrichaeota bacterium]|nr:MAG: hypothetical protein D6681_10630 [Calditrichota bacterium]
METVPNDSRFGQQWALKNSNDADIDATDAWDITTGSDAVVVGIIDTGIDYNHPDLAPNIWRNPGESGGGRENNGVDDDGNGYVDDFRGWDFRNNDNDPSDQNRHGTHVAGIVGAVGNNGRDISGVNWRVKLAALKFLGADGSGNVGDAVEAILYAVRMNIKILNNSWGGSGASQALQDAIETARQAGILFVAAAGNDSKDTDSSPNYPSAYPNENIVAVASSDDRDRMSSFSNWGKTSVDLAAPGSNILSTVPGGLTELSGTSMATPHVVGVAALVMARFPNLDWLSLKYRILGGVDVKNSFRNRMITDGRLNAANALSTRPLITTIPHPNTNNTTSPYTITAFIVDDGSITSATLTYTLSGAATGTDSVSMTAQGIEFSGSIPAQPQGTTVQYTVRARDNQGNVTQGRTLEFDVSGGAPGGGCCGAAALTIRTGNRTTDGALTIAANLLLFLGIVLYFRRRQRK